MSHLNLITEMYSSETRILKPGKDTGKLLTFYRAWLNAREISPITAKEYLAHLRIAGYGQRP